MSARCESATSVAGWGNGACCGAAATRITPAEAQANNRMTRARRWIDFRGVTGRQKSIRPGRGACNRACCRSEPPEGPEKRPNVVGQEFGLFHRGKVPAAGHFRPPHKVVVDGHPLLGGHDEI